MNIFAYRLQSLKIENRSHCNFQCQTLEPRNPIDFQRAFAPKFGVAGEGESVKEFWQVFVHPLSSVEILYTGSDYGTFSKISSYKIQRS